MNLAYILSLLLALLISACSKPLDSEKKFISKVYAELIDIKYEITRFTQNLLAITDPIQKTHPNSTST